MIFTWPSLISEELATKAPSGVAVALGVAEGVWVGVALGVGVAVALGVAEALGLGVAEAVGVADALGLALALAVAVATFAPCFQTSFPLDLTTV